MRFVRVCVLACAVLPTTTFATAHARSRAPALAAECNVSMACDVPRASGTARSQRSQEAAYSRHASLPSAEQQAREALAYAPPSPPVEREGGRSGRTSMSGVVPALAAKVAQIQSACPGSHVISTLRHTRIRGSGRLSLHATGEAVDMRGNPSCVYAQLRDWPGGYSTDYGRAQHVHISLAANGREAGLRFTHGGGRGHRHRRFAKR
jgi:hypothetical protein